MDHHHDAGAAQDYGRTDPEVRRTGDSTAEARENFVARLANAVHFPDPSCRRRLIEEVLRAGIPVDEIIDVCIPEVARRMGADWVADRLGFAEVSVGSARLQGIVRELTPAREAGGAPERMDTANVMMVVRETEQHTLGAMVATSRLRRSGHSVRLSLGRPDLEVARTVAQTSLDAVMLSASPSGDIAALGKFVKQIRAAAAPGLKILVGGSILDQDDLIHRRIGADASARDPEAAVRRCVMRA